MSGFGWYSEPYPAGGAISAEGVRNQLGRPQLSLFEVLTREAIQNSWDARLDTQTVRFAVDGHECDEAQQQAISRLLGQDVPTKGLKLADSLEAEPLRLLVISDRGTTGLGGPTRADIELPDCGPHDFVAFLRNVGEPRDKELGAGTYGFGKTIFYLVSHASTIVVYTRCRLNDAYQSRLIGCAIGESFRQQIGKVLKPYTGRHWWGVPGDGIQEPLLDSAADEAAAAFDLPTFGVTETGTSIVVLDPAFENPAEDMQAIACAITWHTWPKMVADHAVMEFSVSWEGADVPIPDPSQTPPLDAFVSAYRNLQQGERLECYRPEQVLGRLALHRQIVRARKPDYPASFEPPISSPVHHVALMRASHFVVKYHDGTSLPGDAAEYAGVFEADTEIDDVFAQAEPPTHDDWIAAQLNGRSRTFVRTTFARLNERLSAFARPMPIEICGGGGVPLGAASAQFASLVASATAEGGVTTGGPAGRRNEGGGRGGAGGRGGTRGPRGSIEEVGEPEFGEYKGAPAVLFAFRVRQAAPGMHLQARATVGVDESLQAERDAEAPAGAELPRVLGWLGPDQTTVDAGVLPVDRRIGQVWRVAVAPAPDTVTTVSFNLEAVP
jgi:hypothetical protein